MLVSVFVCTFGDVVTYAGIAQEPYRSVSKMMMDATREYPVTECGKALAPYISSLPCPVIVQISKCSLKKALKLLREYVEDNNVITDYTYSTIDDDTLYTCARTVYSTPYPKHIVWGTEEALDTFEEQFFTTPSPHRMLEGSLSDIMTRLFRECIVFSRSPLGHSMAYNKNTRSVIVRTQQYPYVDTFPLYKFCSMAVEWLAFSLEHVLSRILSGCRNDANLTYDVNKTMQLAYQAYRLIHTIEGSKTWLQCTTRPCSTRVHLTQSFAKCLTDYASTPESVRISYEKLRRIYPENHPETPDFRRYKKKVYSLHGEEPIRLSLDNTRLKKTKTLEMVEEEP